MFQQKKEKHTQEKYPIKSYTRTSPFNPSLPDIQQNHCKHQLQSHREHVRNNKAQHEYNQRTTHTNQIHV